MTGCGEGGYKEIKLFYVKEVNGLWAEIVIYTTAC